MNSLKYVYMEPWSAYKQTSQHELFLEKSRFFFLTIMEAWMTAGFEFNKKQLLLFFVWNAGTDFSNCENLKTHLFVIIFGVTEQFIYLNTMVDCCLDCWWAYVPL